MSRRRPGPEEELFEEAMADVRPLDPNAYVPEIVYHPVLKVSEHEREVLRDLDRLVSGEAPFELHDSDEYIEGSVPGLDPRVVKRLHRGEFTIQADLDLHGVAAETARRLVERLLVDASARGLRCVRIVHGRGRNSPGGVPVLKPSLPRWLARGPARKSVLAFTSAAPHDGGAGATYVLLRKSPGRGART